MNNKMNLITVFTPTYNRAHLLDRLYQSLIRQTCNKFEWIIIDDESDDNTEEIVYKFKSEDNDFKILYFRQKHGGKHRAINKALGLASGKMFFIVDSDDFLTDDAIESIFEWEDTIPSFGKYCGVAGLKGNVNGKIEGGKVNFTGEYIDATALDRERYNLLGDKSEVFYTDILKKYPFPEFENEYFVTEAVCWNAMAADGFRMRWFNKQIYICEYLSDGLTINGANEIYGHLKNYKGYLFYIKQSLKIKGLYQSIIDFSDYEKTANYQNLTILQRTDELEISTAYYFYLKFIARPLLLCLRKIQAV